MTAKNYRFLRGDANAKFVTLESWPRGKWAAIASCVGHGVEVETMSAQRCRELRDGLITKFGADESVKRLDSALRTINAYWPPEVAAE